MSNTNVSLSPSSTLSTNNGSSSQFVIFTEQWIDLQRFTAAILKLPINTDDFTETYGTFNSDLEAEISSCIAAFQSLQKAGTTYGDPMAVQKAIAASNGSYWNTQPTALFPQMIWLANELKLSATTIANSIGTLNNMFQELSDAKTKATYLKDSLTGENGLLSITQTMNAKVQGIVSALEHWNINTLIPAMSQIEGYTSSQSSILSAANAAVKSLDDQIKSTHEEAQKAYDDWKKYTLGAIGSSVGVAILSCGIAWPVSAVLGGVLGAKAADERKEHKALEKSIKALDVNDQKKVQLVSDLTGLNDSVGDYKSLIQNLETALGQITQTWSGFETTLNSINSISAEELSTENIVVDATTLNNAKQEWEAMAKTAETFFLNGLQTWDISASLGQNLPEPATA